ncbi:MAG: hypothetical protein ACKOVB_09510 [Terrabacter sp.]
MSLPAAAALLVPSGAVVAWPADHADHVRVQQASVGTVVALADDRPGGRGRLRRAARRLGVRVEAEYVVLPSWRLASFVTTDDAGTLSWLVESFLTTPPGVARGHRVVNGASRIGRRAVATRVGAAAVRLVVTSVVPGRLVVGRRT